MGMNQGELAAVRPRLEEFAAEMFAPLARADQRNKGTTYVRGLLLDGRRKSMQPMAERLGVDPRGLQQSLPPSCSAGARAGTGAPSCRRWQPPAGRRRPTPARRRPPPAA